jgi:hypothetical protein
MPDVARLRYTPHAAIQGLTIERPNCLNEEDMSDVSFKYFSDS